MFDGGTFSRPLELTCTFEVPDYATNKILELSRRTFPATVNLLLLHPLALHLFIRFGLIKNPTPIPSVPVSYTHLDVYKRQQFIHRLHHQIH